MRQQGSDTNDLWGVYCHGDGTGDPLRFTLPGGAYIQAGGGFVGIHSACGSERNWPWFWSMLGGKFIRHCPYQPITVRVIDTTDISTRHLGQTWAWEDEGYYLKDLNPDIHVLLAHDMTSINDKGKEEEE